MPRKIILIPVILLAFFGIVFASMGLFPDTGSFPRFPGGPGTLSGVLSMFRSDGTANNTNMLSGVTASGYLQNNVCDSSSLTNNVWVGVDADGRAICGNTAGLLTAAPIGRLSEFHGTVTVNKSGSLLGYVPATLNMDLYEGDLIHSDPNGTGTIAFHDDASLLRFFVDTDLELRYGLLGGNTVAEAILSDGSLWGRILTSTGVNIGGGGVVTGVRGTSVYLTKTSTGFQLNLVNSTRTDNEVSRLTTTQTTLSNGAKGFLNTTIGSMISVGGNIVSSSSTLIGSGTTVSYGGLATSVMGLVQNPAIYLSTNQWIRDNTIADIAYMSNLLGSTTDTNLITKLNDELDTTVSSGNLLIAEALITGGALVIPADIASGAVLLDEENQTDAVELQTDVNKNKSKRQQCKKLGQTYFPAFPLCQGTWKDLAITDFTNAFGGGASLNLRGKKAKWNFTASGASNNIIATSTGYLEYSGSLVDLQGKTIRIEYTGTPPSSKNIFSDGASSYVKATASSWNFNGVGDFSYSNLPPKYVSFKILSNPIRFIIGNNSSFNAGLSGATITKVSIQ